MVMRRSVVAGLTVAMVVWHIVIGFVVLIAALMALAWRYLLVIGLIVLIVMLWRDRPGCPHTDDIWVMSDRGWVCIRATP